MFKCEIVVSRKARKTGVSDVAAPPMRVTRDVDAIVQVFSHSDYYQLSDRLRAKGFAEDTSDGAPICRWTVGSLILDVMPVDAKLLGFGNKWYVPAAEISKRFQALLVDARFVESVPGHLPTDETNQAREAIILNTVQKIAKTQ